MLASEPGYRAIVSDLHVGEAGPLEDFLFEADFCRFLAHLASQAGPTGRPAELIINGDFFDFLQIAPLRAGPIQDAADKLVRARKGHQHLFTELAAFVRDGHRLVVIPGNHDIELSEGAIQSALRQELFTNDAASQARIIFPDEQLPEHFSGRSRGSFVYRLPGVYIEHGNQFDPFNRFDYSRFYVDEELTQVRLPSGSHFVYRVFNEAESRFGYLDKLRPRRAAFLLFCLLDIRLALNRIGALLGLGAEMVSSELQLLYELSKTQTEVGTGARGSSSTAEQELAWLGQYAEALSILQHEQASMLPGDADLGARGRLSPLFAQAATQILHAVLDLLTSRADRSDQRDDYAQAAEALLQSENADIVLFGHTHGLREIAYGSKRYFNTGTWVGLVDWDLAELRNARPEAMLDFLNLFLKQPTLRISPSLSFVELTYRNSRPHGSLWLFHNGVAQLARGPG